MEYLLFMSWLLEWEPSVDTNLVNGFAESLIFDYQINLLW